MTEDQRPKVTMTKSELTNLLGVDNLVKSNAKTKQFNTMLDLISHFLSTMKQTSGGVAMPTGAASNTSTSGSKSVSRPFSNNHSTTETTQASTSSFQTSGNNSRPSQ